MLTERDLLPFIKGQPKSLNLSKRGINVLPDIINQLASSLTSIDLRCNELDGLCDAFSDLKKLTLCNFGNNKFRDIPDQLAELTELLKLHLFGNLLTSIDGRFLAAWKNLTMLNLNNNMIITLPPEIFYVANLEHLSVSHNKLTELPDELCFLKNLLTLRATHNELVSLPLQLCNISKLRELHLAQNKLRELPESMGRLYQLNVLDVAANELRIFPSLLMELPLKEVHFEQNPLLTRTPVKSVQEEEVMSLKELTTRFIMKDIRNRDSWLRKSLKYYPVVREILSQCSQCAVCGEGFLNTWLECVRFLTPEQMPNVRNNTCGNLIPIRALICSYRCFNTKGHGFYGVAFV